MTRPTATGRPGSQVIPTRWAESHRTTMSRTLRAYCRIERVPAREPFSDEFPAAVDVYEGPCRIQRQSRNEGEPTVGDHLAVVVMYLVVLPWDASVAVRPGDRVLVTVPEASEDYEATPAVNDSSADFVGRPLYVHRLGRGSELWERDLWCSEDQTEGGAAWSPPSS